VITNNVLRTGVKANYSQTISGTCTSSLKQRSFVTGSSVSGDLAENSLINWGTYAYVQSNYAIFMC